MGVADSDHRRIGVEADKYGVGNLHNGGSLSALDAQAMTIFFWKIVKRVKGGNHEVNAPAPEQCPRNICELNI